MASWKTSMAVMIIPVLPEPLAALHSGFMRKAWIFWLREGDILHVLYVGYDDFEEAKAAALDRVGGAAIEAHCELPSKIRQALNLQEGQIIPAHHLQL